MKLLAGLLLCSAAFAGDVSSLGWLAGCWSGTVGQTTFEEQWAKPVSGKMMGMARTLKQDQVVFSEFMRIEQKGAEAVFLPRIGTKQMTVEFTSIRLTDSEVVFENAQHDFPQRVIYRKVDGVVFARIEGMERGKERHEDYPMKSVACR